MWQLAQVANPVRADTLRRATTSVIQALNQTATGSLGAPTPKPKGVLPFLDPVLGDTASALFLKALLYIVIVFLLLAALLGVLLLCLSLVRPLRRRNVKAFWDAKPDQLTRLQAKALGAELGLEWHQKIAENSELDAVRDKQIEALSGQLVEVDQKQKELSELVSSLADAMISIGQEEGGRDAE